MSENRLYKLVIFDWDGTVVDSAGQIVGAMQGAIKDLGLPARSHDDIAQLIGLGLQDAIGRLYPELETGHVLGMLEGYRRHYGNAIEQPAALFPGIRTLLESLSGQDRLLAVATGKSRRGLDRSLGDSVIGHHFAHSRSADETANKPDPRMLLELLEESGMDAGEAVMIGDTEYDMVMARNAGVTGFGVSWGVHDADRQLASGASRVFTSPEELEKALLGNPGGGQAGPCA